MPYKVSMFPANISNLLKPWYRTLLLLVAVLSFGFITRLANLLIIPVFADEAIYIRWAQVMQAEAPLRFIPLTDGKQPLFMWMIIPLLKIIEDPLFAGRLLSVFCGVASILGVFSVSYTLFKNKTISLLSSFFYTISPYTFFFDRMALVDSMLSMFGIWAVFFALLTTKYLRLDLAMLTGFALGAAWLTKSPAMFYFLLVPITFLFKPSKSLVSKNVLSYIKLIALWTVSLFIGFGIYNILRLAPTFHMIAIRNLDYVFTINEVLQHPLNPFTTNITSTLEWYWKLVPGTFFAMAVLAIVFGYRKFPREITFLIVWGVIPVLSISLIAKVFTARYILFTIPPLLILSAVSANQLLKLPKKLAFLSLAVISFPSLFFNYLLITKPDQAPLPSRDHSGYFEQWTSGIGIYESAEYIKSEAIKNPNAKIIIGTEGRFGTLPDGIQIYLNKYPNIAIKGGETDIYQVDPAIASAKKSGIKAYYIVNQSRLMNPPDVIGLKVIKSYPKDKNINGFSDSLLLMEVDDKAVYLFDLKYGKEEK